MSADSKLAGVGELFEQCAAFYKKPVNAYDTMKVSIEAAGSINVHERSVRHHLGRGRVTQCIKMLGRFGCSAIRVALKNGLWKIFPP